MISIQPLDEISTPESISETVEQVMERALEHRPDLQSGAADVRAANAERRQARSAFYPDLKFQAAPTAEWLSFQQQNLPWGHTADLTGSLALNLNWTVFDGGARRSRLAQAEADVRESKARVGAVSDRIEDEVWTAYATLTTAFHQREAATALLTAATQSYNSSLESYNYGVRNLLDVTAAQKVLAGARSADVLARTQVLTALADLAYRAADSIQSDRRTPRQ
jgi:outer membrane protein TolC